MSTKNEVLAILERERTQFVSGQELAEQLSVSRTAIWKAIKCLEEDGHRIEAATNRGYRLSADSDLLTEEGIKDALYQQYKSCPIFVYKTIGSTNTQAKVLSANGAKHGTIIVSEEQTAGKGRSGKSFFSPKDTGLYMSLVLRPTQTLSEPQMITIATAVAVCSAVERLSGVYPKIKWVNDLFLNGKKICGILTEAVTDFESGGIECIIVGVGINCTTSSLDFPDELSDIAGSLGTEGLSRNRLAAEIASGILEYFGRLSESTIIDEYRRRSLMMGKDVCFEINGKVVNARVVGISDLGNLQVKLPDGQEISLNSGEVSLCKDRKLYNE